MKRLVLLGGGHAHIEVLRQLAASPGVVAAGMADDVLEICRELDLTRVIAGPTTTRFLAAYGPIASHFRPRRHLYSTPAYRQQMTRRFQTWREITGTAIAA